MYRWICLILITILCTNCQQNQEVEEPIIEIPAGFELELLYNIPTSQGSWVSLAQGPDSLMFSCDQYGNIYNFTIPSIGGKLDSTQVDSIDLDIGYAHGLLWAYDALYTVIVNGEEGNPDIPISGVYRLNNFENKQFSSVDTMLKLDGSGEHGPHTLRVGPDGNSIYLIAGNFNSVPDHFESKLPKTWQEDNLFPPYLDARGHAAEIEAPGGWIAKADPNGNQWELIAAGFRNPFGFGFNDDGELFAYDADMEWDFGMPWYRPTRILHVTSGAEFGWRTGSGKWPVYYPDNLPSVQDMSQGSPTSVVMGRKLNFPSKYKNGLFACDWSFGTIYHVDLKESGSSYTGTKEEFLSGIPLPISNAIAGDDGHLYFTTGGRRLDSRLYRVRYTGEESTNNEYAKSDKAKMLRQERQKLEKFHSNNNSNKTGLANIWSSLNHDDRHIQYAARIALEHQPVSSWNSLLKKETDPKILIQAGLALARNGSYSPIAIKKLKNIDWTSLSKQDRLSLVRAFALSKIRLVNNQQSVCLAVNDYFGSIFPLSDTDLNREVSQLLLSCGHEDAVAATVRLLNESSSKTIDADRDILSETVLERSERYGPRIQEMLASMPPTESIHYATILSHMSSGWTRETREIYFNWFEQALAKKGGMSYKSFLDNIRVNALSHVPEEEQEYFRQKSGFYSPIAAMASLPQPHGPGSEYNLIKLGEIALWGDKLDEYSGSYADGVRAYEAALCKSCHQMKGDGGASGPDLTNIHTRFEKGEIADALLNPSEEISDQYEFTKFDLTDGSSYSGRIVKSSDQSYEIYQNPYDITTTTTLNKADIQSMTASAISPMPAKLLDRLNEQEVLDLFVYLLSGADPKHKLYTKIDDEES